MLLTKTLESHEFTEELVGPLFREVESSVPDEFRVELLDLKHVVKEWRGLGKLGIAKTWVSLNDGALVGILGALFIPEFFSGKPMAMEQFWFVTQEFRKTPVPHYLFQEFAEEAKICGSKTLWSGTNTFNEPERMKKMYERNGMIRWGENYRKVLE